MDENEQYSPREFYYPDEETKENANFVGKSQKQNKAVKKRWSNFLIGQRAKTTV